MKRYEESDGHPDFFVTLNGGVATALIVLARGAGRSWAEGECEEAPTQRADEQTLARRRRYVPQTRLGFRNRRGPGAAAGPVQVDVP